MPRPVCAVTRWTIAVVAVLFVVIARAAQAIVDRMRRDAAFKRMKANTYGQCTACGDEISLGRLESDPAARRCRACVTHARA